MTLVLFCVTAFVFFYLGMFCAALMNANRRDKR